MNTVNLPCPALPTLRPRKPDGHKGDYGRGLLIGGSFAMPGAIAMSALAAATSGAGLVRIAVPSCIAGVVAGYSPCATLHPLEFDTDKGTIEAQYDAIADAASAASCLAVGPGLGRSKVLDCLLSEIVLHNDSPMIIDADGLNALGSADRICDLLSRRKKPGKVVLTPHPGEWQWLSGTPASDREGQIEAAIEFSRRSRAVVLLKGQHSVITDGNTLVVNPTGTPAMATGGSGDVLTGIITALVCQGLSIRDAAHLAAHVHGLSGEIAQQRLGYHVVLPTELIASLPAAFSQISAARRC